MSSKRKLKNILGNYSLDLQFEFEEDTDSNGGCGAILMDKMIYFGGIDNKRQVCKSFCQKLLFNPMLLNFFS